MDYDVAFHLIVLFKPNFQEPDIQIDGAALDSWNRDQLDDAEALLTTAINRSRNLTHHVLASRALVRARLKKWDEALVDAEKVLVVLFLHSDADINLRQGHQHSAVCHCLRRKRYGACRQWRKTQGLSVL